MQAQKEKEIDIEISNVIVGGSVAHGTAIPGYFDIDITIFSPSKGFLLHIRLHQIIMLN